MFLRTLMIRLFPGKALQFERESRQWMVQCQHCKHQISVWDAGGIRYKARGTVRRLGKCSTCGKVSWLRIYRKADDDALDPT